MLAKAALVKNGIERLHEEVVYFFAQIENTKRWSKRLFNQNFYDQVVKKNQTLENLLKDFLKEFIALPAQRKVEIIQEFKDYNLVGELCNNTKITVTRYWQDSAYLNFCRATKVLFVFMFEETLGRSTYKAFSGESIKDHYNAYRSAYNLSMCPFCGLEDYKDLHDELSLRDAYDHYLDKARYPFAAVNPDNLFPMCHDCNSGAKKTADILHKDKTSQRRLAAYPPDNEFHVSIKVDDALLLEPHITIDLIEPIDPHDLEKFETWLTVFKIRQRYEGRVKKKKKDWLTSVLASIASELTEEALKLRLKELHNQLLVSLEMRVQREDYLQASFLSYCVDHAHSVISFVKNDPAYTSYLMKRSTTLNS